MGSFGQKIGIQSNFQASNPYDPSYLQSQVQNQQQVYQQQQDLASKLSAMAAGEGPNPAQTLYNQNVNQNIQNAQGMIASQRGLNPALATRMGANLTADANQQAAGQSALLNQQQQLGALDQMSGLYGQMQQGTLQGQGLYGQQHLGAQQMNMQTKAQNASQMGQLYGSLIGAAAKGASMAATGGASGAAGAYGGMVSGPQSLAGQRLAMKHGGMVPGNAPVKGDSPKNDKVQAVLSPGEIVVPRSVVQGKDAPDKAKQFVAAILARQGMKERRK